MNSQNIVTTDLVITGEVLRPGDAQYDESRRLFDARYDKKPSLIARCADTSDVVAAVNFAGENGLEISVRGGGRHMAGWATNDGGLVIDLSQMNGVEVDVEDRTAVVAGGANGGDVQVAAGAAGLGAVTGLLNHIGFAGAALGGGVGVNSAGVGWSCDSIISAEIVTADGQVLTASADENPDLYWAIRGAGPNFGIVTSLRVRLHPVPERVLAGQLLWTVDKAPKVLRYLQDLMDTGSRDLNVLWDLSVAPADPAYPEHLHGKPVLGFAVFHVGAPDDAAREVQELRTFEEPEMDTLDYMSFAEVHFAFADAYPPDRQYWDECHVHTLSDDVIGALLEQANKLAASALDGLNLITCYPVRGAMVGPPSSPTSFANREAGWSVGTFSFWSDPDGDAAHRAWTRNAITEIEAACETSGRVYLNGVTDVDEQRVRSAYGEGYERLAALKAKYDPENIFHLNANVPPANT